MRKTVRDPLTSVTKADYILLTHGHRDHVGDAVEIAKQTQAVLIRICLEDHAALVEVSPHVRLNCGAIVDSTRN